MTAPLPVFVECGCCGAFHNIAYSGDCRNDDERFNIEDLDEMYGEDGWVEAEPPKE